MPLVEAYENQDDSPIFEGNFDFLPRVGETVSHDAGGYFDYYEVLEIWHRQDFGTDGFRACLAVKLKV